MFQYIQNGISWFYIDEKLELINQGHVERRQ